MLRPELTSNGAWPTVGRMAMGVFDVISKAVVAVDALRDRIRPERTEVTVPPVPKTAEIVGSDAAAAAPVPAPVEASRSEEEPSMGDPSIAAQIYGRRSCSWCGRAIQLLQAEGVDYRFINLDDDEGMPLETALVKETKQYTVPYIFLRGQYVGGYHALDEVVRFGQLEQMTAPPDARSVPRSGEIKIVIPKR